jgi:hypothetical protein
MSGVLDAEMVKSLLSAETIKVRDQIKRDTGQILTVADTRAALEALHDLREGRGSLQHLTANQRRLVEAWRKRLAAVVDQSSGAEN